MSNYIKALDNVGVICNANKENFLKFEKMGFQLYPLGRQGVKLAGMFIKAGTGSIAAHFKNGGYFEMISIYNNILPTGGYKKILHKRGEQFIKFTVELTNAKAEAQRLKQQNKPVFGPMEFRRVFTSVSKGKQDARFSIIGYPFPKNYPINVAGTEHLTPKVTWQDDLIDHPNGTLLLSNVLIVVSNIHETVKQYESIFAKTFEKKKNKWISYFDNHSRITLISQSDLKDEFPNIEIDSVSFIAAVYFGVKNIETVNEILTKNNIPFKEKSNQLIVPKEYVFNSTFVFEECP